MKKLPSRKSLTPKAEATDSAKTGEVMAEMPGLWVAIHTIAANSHTDSEKRSCIRYVTLLCEGLRCNTCLLHAREYRKEVPMENYLDTVDSQGRDIGMLYWTWMFHNAVNTRLNRSFALWNDVYNRYNTTTNVGVCMQDCGK